MKEGLSLNLWVKQGPEEASVRLREERTATANTQRNVSMTLRQLRNELRAREVFDTLLEANVLIERWRKVSTTVRAQLAQVSATGYAIGNCAVGVMVPRTPNRYARATSAVYSASEGNCSRVRIVPEVPLASLTIAQL